ncbi:MAG: hypothetical protein ACYC7J_17850 [Syntrophales bacterium]
MFLLMVVLCCGCSHSSGNEAAVGFQVTTSYFVKNTYRGETNPSYLVIRSYPSFDSVFGAANADPAQLITEEKMKTGFVVSIIYQGNDIHEFAIDKIIVKDDQLQVHYTSEVTMPNASWTCNCHVTALIDNSNFSSIRFFENGNPLPNASVKELP